MPTIEAIVSRLVQEGLVESAGDWPMRGVVSHLAPLEAAAPGALCWLSAKRWRTHPESLADFKGALVILPADAPAGKIGNGVGVRCRTPKLAFARAAELFFPELLGWPWPTPPRAVDPSARVHPSARLGPGVVIGAGVELGEGVEIGPGTAIAHASVGARTTIGAQCAIGLPGFGYERAEDGRWFRFPHVGRVVIEADVEIGSNTCIDRGALGVTTVGRGAKIDNLVHVAHNVTIGPDALVIAHAMLGGSAEVGAGAWVAPSAAVMNQAKIGAGAVIGLGAVVLKDVAAGTTVVGNPAKVLAPKGERT